MNLNYCPECAWPLTRLDNTNYHCQNGHKYYNNPHAACSVIFVNDNHELLFAKRADDPFKGKYDFPGGFLEDNETPYQAAVREVREELGITVETEDLLLTGCSLNDYDENTTVADFAFMCWKWSGTMRPADDVAAAEWHPLEFVRSDKFAWPHPYLYDKLQKQLNHVPTSRNN